MNIMIIFSGGVRSLARFNFCLKLDLDLTSASVPLYTVGFPHDGRELDTRSVGEVRRRAPGRAASALGTAKCGSRAPACWQRHCKGVH